MPKKQDEEGMNRPEKRRMGSICKMQARSRREIRKKDENENGKRIYARNGDRKKESRPMESGLLVQNQVYAGLDCAPIYKGIWGSERKMEEAEARGSYGEGISHQGCVVSCQGEENVLFADTMRCDAMRWRSGGLSRRWKETVNTIIREEERMQETVAR
jgi:hypothetical protein